MSENTPDVDECKHTYNDWMQSSFCPDCGVELIAPLLDLHPAQSIVHDSNGIVRFRENKIVRYLLDHGGIDLNDLACMKFPREDQIQFAQLIGYSVLGFGTLSYVDEVSYQKSTRETTT